MTTTRIRLVCFDLGGVIVRTCASWREACERAGLPAHAEAETPAAEARIRALDDQHQIGHMTEPEFYFGVAEATGGIYRQDEVARIHHAWLLGEYRGAEGLVSELKDRDDLATACLSNTNQPHWEVMSSDGKSGAPTPVMPYPAPMFPAFQMLEMRHASHLLGLAKPSPEIYQAFEQQTGFRGGEILFFDDRADNVEAARSAGWQAELVDTPADPVARMREVLRRRRI